MGCDMGEMVDHSTLSEADKQALKDWSDNFCASYVTIANKEGWTTNVRCDRPHDHTGRHRGTSPQLLVAWSQ